MAEYEITVIDHHEVDPRWRKRMAGAKGLVEVGVPLKVAERWQRVRREMTVGLRRRLREQRN